MTALVTTSEIKNYLQITSNIGPTTDDNLNSLANYASSAIESFCGREFSAADYTEIHDGGRTSIFVDRIPINSINVVWEYNGLEYKELVGSQSSDELANVSANANATPGFSWDSETGQIMRDTSASSGFRPISLIEAATFANYRRGVKIQYNGGYTNIPEDIKMATLDYIKLLYKQEQGTSSFTLSGENKEAKPLTSSKFPPHIERVLSLYRIL